jgi:hypothetical protein
MMTVIRIVETLMVGPPMLKFGPVNAQYENRDVVKRNLLCAVVPLIVESHYHLICLIWQMRSILERVSRWNLIRRNWSGGELEMGKKS